jgi:hypothetical protein
MKMLVIPNRIRENLDKADSQADFYDLCILCLYLTEQASTPQQMKMLVIPNTVESVKI